jgi:hypothetical protein
MWLIHEHSQISNPMDNYWVIKNRIDALFFFKDIISKYINNIDIDYYENMNEDNNNKINKEEDHDDIIAEKIMDHICENGDYVNTSNGDYLVLTKLNKSTDLNIQLFAGCKP